MRQQQWGISQENSRDNRQGGRADRLGIQLDLRRKGRGEFPEHAQASGLGTCRLSHHLIREGMELQGQRLSFSHLTPVGPGVSTTLGI